MVNLPALKTIWQVPELKVGTLLFLAPAFFLVVKGWGNAVVFVLTILSVVEIYKNPKYYLVERRAEFWKMFLVLISPLFCELVVQIGRLRMVPSSLDGPSRFLLAGIIFIYFSRLKCKELLKPFIYGSGLGIVMVFLSIHIFPEQYWHSRAATYFVDPITLPCYVTVLFGVYLFSQFDEQARWFGPLSKSILGLLTLNIAILSGSRGSWIALCGLVIVYCSHKSIRNLRVLVLQLLLITVGLYALYCFSPIVQSRTDDALSGVVPFLIGDVQSHLHAIQNTGTGQRIVLALLDFELILQNPLFGLSDDITPPRDALLSSASMVDDEIYMIKELAGSHSEYLAQLVRKGLIFGGILLWALFIYPIYRIFWVTRTAGESNGAFRNVFVGVWVPLSLSAVSIQVFNLKMTSSFYGLCLALFFALAYQVMRRASVSIRN